MRPGHTWSMFASTHVQVGVDEHGCGNARHCDWTGNTPDSVP